jgi:hypothetical protein
MIRSIKHILILLLALQFHAKAQTEFLVTVNPTTGTDSIIDSLHGVNWIYDGTSAFDKNNHRYFFEGKDFGGNVRLYTIKATDATISSQPIISSQTGGFCYDDSSNTLYGLYLNSPLGQMYLASFDTLTAAASVIDTLPDKGISAGTTFFDNATHTYVLLSANSFYSFNVISRKISITPAPANLGELEFDNVTGIPYGLITIPSLKKMIFVSLNISKGTYTTLDTLPTMAYTSDQNSFNELGDIYTFCNGTNLYSVSASSDNVVSSPVFPVGMTYPANVIELQYDNSDGVLYALHWGPVITDGITNITNNGYSGFELYPNPTSSLSVLRLNKQYEKIDVSVYNSLGQSVSKSTKINAKDIEINNEAFPSGIYFISVIADNRYLGTRKLVID